MARFTDLDTKLRCAVREEGEEAPPFPLETIRGRASALRPPARPARRRLGWRWALAAGVLAACLSATAVAFASPQAAASMQSAFVRTGLMHLRDVTLAQARVDAGYPLVIPAGLPTGTRLVGISELPGVGAAPPVFTFRYQAPSGSFAIGESPVGDAGFGVLVYTDATGKATIVAGRPPIIGLPPAAGGTGGAWTVSCTPEGTCTMRRTVHTGSATLTQTKTVTCRSGPMCSVREKDGKVVVTAGPGVPPGTVVRGHVNITMPPAAKGAVTVSMQLVSWRVAGMQLNLMNPVPPDTLTQAQIDAIRAATKAS